MNAQNGTTKNEMITNEKSETEEWIIFLIFWVT